MLKDRPEANNQGDCRVEIYNAVDESINRGGFPVDAQLDE